MPDACARERKLLTRSCGVYRVVARMVALLSGRDDKLLTMGEVEQMDTNQRIEAEFKKMGLASASDRAAFQQYSKPDPQPAKIRVVVSDTSQPFKRR